MNWQKSVGVVLTAALVSSASASASQPVPQRIMSLNLCADVLLLHLVPRERIASVSFLAATSPLSPVQELAQGLPVNDSQIEEILLAQPDLVLAHRYSDPRVLHWLKRLAIPTVTVDLPTSIEEALAQWQRVGAALGAEQKAEAMVVQARARLEAVSSSPLTPALSPPAGRGKVLSAPLAAVYGPNGITQGRGSLLDDLLRSVGFRNLAAELALTSLATLPLEELARASPQVLVLAGDAPHVQTLAGMSLTHPVLRRLGQRARIVELPGRYWSCGGPELIEAVERLALARAQQSAAR
ncbi:MAG: ABC transporter substrate-binding protein [Nevskiales bacterium]